MNWWQVAALANAVILAAYLAISVAIARGLWRSRQWRNNPLGLATAAIFFTCAVHHGSHTLHLLLPYVGLETESGLAMRTAFGADYHASAWDIISAAVAVWYWTLRSRFPALVRGAAVFEDLRLRQAAEQTLRASEERYRSIVETTSEGLVLLDSDGRIGYANAQFAAMIGRTVAELSAVALTDLVAVDQRAEAAERLDRLAATGHERCELRLCRPDGRDVCVQLALTARRSQTGRFDGALAMVADITEQKSVEAQLRQAQKLDAVGQLAGGVAHDFNNLLTVIDGYAALLLADIASGQAWRPELAAIRTAAARATVLTRQLLTFSRTQASQPRVIDINELVAGLEEMLRRLIREDICLLVAATADPATVLADPGQMEQVLVNLVVNGRDAMPDGGSLTIVTRHVDLDAGEAASLGGQPGGYLLLTVADTGHGIPADVRARMFEPFFTTKDQGKGTGLGLSTVYGIITQASGHIAVDSESDAGATFRIYLPAVAAPACAPEPEHEAGRPARGTETILLVEDDPSVRNLTERILADAGYQVLAAANGQQALSLVQQRLGGGDRPVDLLLTDVIMPGMNGQQLANRLTALSPGLPVVFASAYTRGVLSHNDSGTTITYLDKPFTAYALTETIRSALDARERTSATAARSPHTS